MSVFCSAEVFHATIEDLTLIEQRAVELCKGEVRNFLGREVVEYLDSDYHLKCANDEFYELAGDLEIESYEKLYNLVFEGNFHALLKTKAFELNETVMEVENVE